MTVFPQNRVIFARCWFHGRSARRKSSYLPVELHGLVCGGSATEQPSAPKIRVGLKMRWGHQAPIMAAPQGQHFKVDTKKRSYMMT